MAIRERNPSFNSKFDRLFELRSEIKNLEKVLIGGKLPDAVCHWNQELPERFEENRSGLKRPHKIFDKETQRKSEHVKIDGDKAKRQQPMDGRWQQREVGYGYDACSIIGGIVPDGRAKFLRQQRAAAKNTGGNGFPTSLERQHKRGVHIVTVNVIICARRDRRYLGAPTFQFHAVDYRLPGWRKHGAKLTREAQRLFWPTLRTERTHGVGFDSHLRDNAGARPGRTSAARSPFTRW